MRNNDQNSKQNLSAKLKAPAQRGEVRPGKLGDPPKGARFAQPHLWNTSGAGRQSAKLQRKA